MPPMPEVQPNPETPATPPPVVEEHQPVQVLTATTPPVVNDPPTPDINLQRSVPDNPLTDPLSYAYWIQEQMTLIDIEVATQGDGSERIRFPQLPRIGDTDITIPFFWGIMHQNPQPPLLPAFQFEPLIEFFLRRLPIFTVLVF